MSRVKKAAKIEGTHIIGYVRVSTDDQARSGVGLEVQREAIRKECERKGWNLLEIIEDPGISGKSLRRPGLQRALLMLTEGKATGLMVAKLDRLSRSVSDVCQLADMAQHYGFDLIVLDPQIDTTSPYGRAQLSMMATIAQLERELIAQRTKEALAIKKAKRVRLGRKVSMSPDIVEMIYALRSQGCTLRAIAEILNTEGIPTAQGGNAWHASTVKAVLDRLSRAEAA